MLLCSSSRSSRSSVKGGSSGFGSVEERIYGFDCKPDSPLLTEALS